MGFSVLVDDLEGNAEDFYGLVSEEVKRRGLEGMTFDWVEEVETTKMLGRGEKARALRVSYKYQHINVLAFKVGTGYLFSVRMTRSSDPDKSGILFHLLVCWQRPESEPVQRSDSEPPPTGVDAGKCSSSCC